MKVTNIESCYTARYHKSGSEERGEREQMAKNPATKKPHSGVCACACVYMCVCAQEDELAKEARPGQSAWRSTMILLFYRGEGRFKK